MTDALGQHVSPGIIRLSKPASSRGMGQGTQHPGVGGPEAGPACRHPGPPRPADHRPPPWMPRPRPRINLGTMLRLLDARAGSYVEVRPACRGLLRVCAHVPGTAGETDITWLRVLLAADLLARTAELDGLQVLTVLAFAGQASAQAAAFERAADALGIHPPAARASVPESHTSAGGPIDVHLDAQGAGADSGRPGLVARVGAARLSWADDHGEAAMAGVLAGHGSDPLAARLALVSVPYYQPADLTEDMLADARETIAHWRSRVAEWAESPSRPIPARIADTIRATFNDLDTVAAIALLRDLAADDGVPAGARFETFVYADRVLGLDLPRDIGRTGH
jgi:hypothetical protein